MDESSIEMWVGLKILVGIIFIFGKMLVGPENAKKKIGDLWKQNGGWVLNNTQNKFLAYLLQIFA